MQARKDSQAGKKRLIGRQEKTRKKKKTRIDLKAAKKRFNGSQKKIQRQAR